MTSILVYKPKLASGDTDTQKTTKRRAGMLKAGADLRDELKNVETDKDVEDAVNKVVYDLVTSNNENVFLEARKSDGSMVNFEIVDKSGDNFSLTNVDDSTDDKKKLKLNGAVDDFKSTGNGVYRMTAVSPFKPNKSTSWEYLAQKVHADLKAIEVTGNPTDIEDYLIATFAFTRCR